MRLLLLLVMQDNREAVWCTKNAHSGKLWKGSTYICCQNTCSIKQPYTPLQTRLIYITVYRYIFYILICITVYLLCIDVYICVCVYIYMYIDTHTLCLSQQIKFKIICIKQIQLADPKVYLTFQTMTFQWEIIKLGYLVFGLCWQTFSKIQCFFSTKTATCWAINNTSLVFITLKETGRKIFNKLLKKGGNNCISSNTWVLKKKKNLKKKI